MCGSPASQGPDEARDLALFVRVLREVFDHEPWVDVEPCARRAWTQIAQINGVQWEHVHDSVRRSWQLH
ncbi:hypothetical protein AB4059_04935 [Lysobacter sp. 2RAF19]